MRIRARGRVPLDVDPLPETDGAGVIDAGTFTLQTGSGLKGVVRLPDGTPARRGNVSAHQADGSYQSSEIDEQGQYHIQGLIPGEATLNANAYPERPNTPGANLSELKVTVPQQGSTTLDLRLENPKPRQ